jgi:hypothetical protein
VMICIHFILTHSLLPSIHTGTSKDWAVDFSR